MGRIPPECLTIASWTRRHRRDHLPDSHEQNGWRLDRTTSSPKRAVRPSSLLTQLVELGNHPSEPVVEMHRLRVNPVVVGLCTPPPPTHHADEHWRIGEIRYARRTKDQRSATVALTR